MLSEPMECGASTLFLTCTTGIAVFPSSVDESALKVLQNADTARSRAMQAGGDNVTFFESSMGDRAKQQFLLAQQLKEAIDGDQLRLHLQAQVDVNRNIVGVEALVRWQHPTRGLLTPGEFIPQAEQSRLIVSLDRWVLREACAVISQLMQHGHPLRIAVNVSPRHFAEPNFVSEIQLLVDEKDIRPDLLTLEVTEGLMIQNTAEVADKMRQIHAIGVRFSIDDFGTGYSSLAYLRKLPIHELKIDQSFVREAPDNPSDAVLVQMIDGIARLLKIDCVAEGVETEQHRALLRCYPDLLQQGYLYGRPAPAETWLKDYIDSQHAVAHNKAE